jgi:hypothetical protein
MTDKNETRYGKPHDGRTCMIWGQALPELTSEEKADCRMNMLYQSTCRTEAHTFPHAPDINRSKGRKSRAGKSRKTLS